MIENPTQSSKLLGTLKYVVELLVAGKYDAIESFSNGVRLKAEHMRASAGEYGRTLVLPNASQYEQADVVVIDGEDPLQYSIRFRLYTSEEGQSDLEIQATFIDQDSESTLMQVEVDGILVA